MLISAEHLLILGACKVRTRVPRSAGTHFQVKRVLPRDSASKTPLEPLSAHAHCTFTAGRRVSDRHRHPPPPPPDGKSQSTPASAGEYMFITLLFFSLIN